MIPGYIGDHHSRLILPAVTKSDVQRKIEIYHKNIIYRHRNRSAQKYILRYEKKGIDF